MNVAKIQLSEEELLLVQNAEWLLTKNRIIGKVYELFGHLATDVQRLLERLSLPEETCTISPKISKGENYQGLPYVMLDYPRCFGKSDTFAVRTMFWWGNFFSTTLQLKGIYKDQFLPSIQRNLRLLSENNLYLHIHFDEWRHDFENDNYVLIADADQETIKKNLLEKNFCKLAGKIDLNNWETIPARLLKFYETLLMSVANSRADEKDL